MNESASNSARRAFVFVGGGTGGHLYPALAIFEQLRAIEPDVGVHILCSNRAIDAQILGKEAVPFSPIPAMPVSKKPRGLMRFIASWGPSVRATRQQIQRFKQSHDSVTVVAMGGFVAAPGARAGHAEKVPVILVNLDAVPGKANVLIAKKATKIFTAANLSDAAGFDTWQRTRPIVRSATTDSISPQDARAAFGLDPDTSTLLVTGGSQGAASITNFVRTMVDQSPQVFANWQVIHQVGNTMSDTEIDQLRSTYRDAKINAWVERYIDEMGTALSAADVALGRCGAGTVAECWAARVPSVFFPYPYHKDEHQKHNAQILVDAGAAIVLDDHINPERNFQAHRQAFANVLESQHIRTQMHTGFASLGCPDGAHQIARALLNGE
jgi:UDP-N-acetylglucosamine--N-acetylmuramyl-(pentapeptide) pyrophosphoryl-undecaprenol N-acetylglucosamine transferase